MLKTYCLRLERGWHTRGSHDCGICVRKLQTIVSSLVQVWTECRVVWRRDQELVYGLFKVRGGVCTPCHLRLHNCLGASAKHPWHAWHAFNFVWAFVISFTVL
jgi:hypothetical protein